MVLFWTRLKNSRLSPNFLNSEHVTVLCVKSNTEDVKTTNMKRFCTFLNADSTEQACLGVRKGRSEDSMKMTFSWFSHVFSMSSKGTFLHSKWMSQFEHKPWSNFAKRSKRMRYLNFILSLTVVMSTQACTWNLCVHCRIHSLRGCADAKRAQKYYKRMCRLYLKKNVYKRSFLPQAS